MSLRGLRAVGSHYLLTSFCCPPCPFRERGVFIPVLFRAHSSGLQGKHWGYGSFVIVAPLPNHLGLTGQGKIAVQRVVRAVCNQLRRPLLSRRIFWWPLKPDPLPVGKERGPVTSCGGGVVSELPVIWLHEAFISAFSVGLVRLCEGI